MKSLIPVFALALMACSISPTISLPGPLSMLFQGVASLAHMENPS